MNGECYICKERVIGRGIIVGDQTRFDGCSTIHFECKPAYDKLVVSVLDIKGTLSNEHNSSNNS